MPTASQATLNEPLLNHIGQVLLLSKQYLTDIVMLSLISSYTYSQRIEKKQQQRFNSWALPCGRPLPIRHTA